MDNLGGAMRKWTLPDVKAKSYDLIFIIRILGMGSLCTDFHIKQQLYIKLTLSACKGTVAENAMILGSITIWGELLCLNHFYLAALVDKALRLVPYLNTRYLEIGR